MKITRVCGVTIKSAEAILVIVEMQDGNFIHVAQKLTKLKLADSKNSSDVQNLAKVIDDLAQGEKIDVFAIKSRQSKGQMSSSGITFKIEGLFQLQKHADCKFISPQAITKIAKGNIGTPPATVNKYQYDSYKAAVVVLSKEI